MFEEASFFKFRKHAIHSTGVLFQTDLYFSRNISRKVQQSSLVCVFFNTKIFPVSNSVAPLLGEKVQRVKCLCSIIKSSLISKISV